MLSCFVTQSLRSSQCFRELMMMSILERKYQSLWIILKESFAGRDEADKKVYPLNCLRTNFEFPLLNRLPWPQNWPPSFKGESLHTFHSSRKENLKSMTRRIERILKTGKKRQTVTYRHQLPRPNQYESVVQFAFEPVPVVWSAKSELVKPKLSIIVPMFLSVRSFQRFNLTSTYLTLSAIFRYWDHVISAFLSILFSGDKMAMASSRQVHRRS